MLSTEKVIFEKLLTLDLESHGRASGESDIQVRLKDEWNLAGKMWLCGN